MKKHLLALFVIVFVFVNVHAQQAPVKTLNLQTESFPSLSFKTSTPFFYQHHMSLRLAGVEWFDYAATISTISSHAIAHYDYLFPDSNIRASYAGFVENPDVHSIATVLDPKWPLFDYTTSFQPTPADSFTVDSVAFLYFYFRNAASNAVDTLQLNVFGSSNAPGNDILYRYYSYSPNNPIEYGVDTTYFAGIRYDRSSHKPIEPVSLTVKIPLDKNSLTDTVSGGYHVATISTGSLGYLHGLVVASAAFIPGYSYSLNDTLNNLNYILFNSIEENGNNTFPTYYQGYLNESYIIDNSVQYNINQHGYDSLYEPTLSYGSDYVYEDHNFSFLIDCASCVNGATAVKTPLQAPNNVIVFPNPCSTCQINGINNPADLLVTDLLGRNINVSFTKTANGYLMSLPNESGLFFARNIKTGEVVKFVKE